MSKSEASAAVAETATRSMGGFQKLSMGLIASIFALSIVCRVALGGSSAEEAPAVGGANAVPGMAQGFVPGDNPSIFPPSSQPEQQPAEPGALEAFLPVLTEASFFAMVGFALGYASRKVVKLAMIGLAAFFVLLQVLTYSGVTTIDWSRLVEILNDWILNLKENQTITDVLTDRVPTAGSLIAGYVLGFRKG